MLRLLGIKSRKNLEDFTNALIMFICGLLVVCMVFALY